MSSAGSVTRLIGLLKEGDRDAAQGLWEAYSRRVVVLARAKLLSTPRASADEEDVALSAFDSFFRRAEAGQFPRLDDRDDLWQILFVITVRKAIDLARHHGRRSRGAGRVRSVGDFEGLDVEGAVSAEPTPEFAAQVSDECRHLFDRLGDRTLASVALWKMEGYTNADIARRLGCVEKTVERKLRSIRRIWSAEARP